MHIQYNQQIQPRNLEEIKKHLLPWLWLVPAWAGWFYVNLWDNKKEDDLYACTVVEMDYRRISLDFYTAWLDQTDELKEALVVHELCHAHLSVVANFARKIVDDLCPETEAPKFHKHLRDTITEKCEGSVQDLARILTNRL